jgi:branched-chain amino acid transport system permease protein
VRGRRPSPIAIGVAVLTVAFATYALSRQNGVEGLLQFTVVGLAAGCTFALAAMGVVVTYTTSGIFNFAHGGLGMLLAFAYWDLSQNHGWPAPIALAVTLLVFAPLLGALVERVLMRNLHGAPTQVSLVVTTALLLVTLGVSVEIWDQGVARQIPQFFGNRTVGIFGINVTYHQIISVLAAIAAAIGLRLFFYRTRLGVAMRAVVDDPELAALNGATPARVAQASWALGCMMAGLSFILIAPLGRLEVIVLALGVLSAFAATVVGKLKSLPMTFAGAIGLGLVVNYGTGYLPDIARGLPLSDRIASLQPALPTIFLFIALLAAPQARLRAGRIVTIAAPRVPSLRDSIIGGVAFVLFIAFLTGVVSAADQIAVGRGVALMFVGLSLVLLTGYGGQTSLCQLTFVGVSSFTFAKVAAAGNPLGLVPAVLAAMLVGLVVALVAVRLQGLYLALATLAFAQAMDLVFFQDVSIFGFGGRLAVPRVSVFGMDFTTDRSYIIFTAILLAASAVAVLALRRGPFGRRLTAMSDSPAACATLGLNQTTTKLIVFAMSSALAGLAGVFWGGIKLGIAPDDVTMLQSLVLLLVITVGGINSVTGAFIGGFVFAVIPVLQQHVSFLENVQGLQFLGVGFGAILLARRPNGIAGELFKLRDRFRRQTAVPSRASSAREIEMEVDGLAARPAG